LFVRQKLEGWTNAELGRAIGVPAERVKYRMFRARAILKERVNSLSSLPRGPLARSAQTALPSSGF
jgi:DNA-directed RNA polymerase specialized sigma24 family protein